MALVLPAILLLAAALRLWGLGREHPFDDDYCQIYTALHPDGLAAFLRLARGNPHHALLDPLTTFFAAKLQPIAFWARLPSALEGVAVVALTMRFAKPAGERRIALTGLLLAVSLLHAQWSRGVNFYALLTLLSVLHSYLFLELLAGRRGWLAYSASACVFLHAHPYAILFLPFHAFWARKSPEFAALMRAWGAALCLFVPWFLWSWRGLLDLELFQGAYRRSPLNIGLGEFLLHAPLSLAGVAAEVGPPARWSPGPASLAALLLATAYALSLRRSLRGLGSPTLNYAHALFAYGFLCVIVLDRAYGYFYSPRQLLWLFPFYLYGAADGLCLLAERLRRPALGLAPHSPRRRSPWPCRCTPPPSAGASRRAKGTRPSCAPSSIAPGPETASPSTTTMCSCRCSTPSTGTRSSATATCACAAASGLTGSRAKERRS